MSEQLGPYFQKNRLFTGIQIPVNLNRNWWSSYGMTIGGVNYNMVASTAGVGGSQIVPDLNFGFSFKYKDKLSLGFTASQLLNLTIQPIAYKFTIERFYEVQIEYTKEIDVHWGLNLSARIQSKGNQFYYVRLENELGIFMGMNIRSTGLYSFLAGYELKKIENLHILIAVAYTNSFKPNAVNRENIELYTRAKPNIF